MFAPASLVRDEIADRTGPLSVIRDRRILIIADVQNLAQGARDLGFHLSWSTLARKLTTGAASASRHAVFARRSDDHRRSANFFKWGWIPHAKTIEMHSESNADNVLAFMAGSLISRMTPDVIVLGTGDGSLAEDVAEAISSLIPHPRPVVTLSFAASTAGRLNAQISSLVTANIEIGRDCLVAMEPKTRFKRPTRGGCPAFSTLS